MVLIDMNMKYRIFIQLPFATLLAVLMACGQKQDPVVQQSESQEAKRLLQGVWMDEETEAVAFQMKGDTIYYADSTSMPAFFKVVGDSLCIGTTTRYHIEKHTDHVLWFTNQGGEVAKFVKADTTEVDASIPQNQPQILTLTEVLKRDSVVFFEGKRYHIYVAINPTKYKVTLQTVNEDGLNVENVYYDNIIHVSIYQDARQLFSRDFKKQAYAQRVPNGYLEQAVLNDMQYSMVDADGFHFNASVCKPDNASCYLIEQVISFKGHVSTKLLED